MSTVDARRPGDVPGEPAAGARSADLAARLGRLAPGHPSSPYEAGGSPRPPAVRLRDLELPEEAAGPRPLTDAEYAARKSEVRAALEKARTDGLATDHQHTTDPDRTQWTAERDRLHGQLVTHFLDQAREVPCDRHAIVAGGLGGAGKSTVLAQQAGIDRSRYLTINPDDIKEEMARRGLVPEVDGLSPMEASDLVHEESSAVAKQLSRKALAQGKNVIWDITMSSRESTEQRISALRAAGYARVDGIFVDIPTEISARRADARHRQAHDAYLAGYGLGGRFVPPDVIESRANPKWGSDNRSNFEAAKPRFDSWWRYDNSVDGQAARLAESSETTRREKADEP